MWCLEFGSLHGPKESMQVYVYRLEAGFHVTALGPKYIEIFKKLLKVEGLQRLSGCRL